MKKKLWVVLFVLAVLSISGCNSKTNENYKKENKDEKYLIVKFDIDGVTNEILVMPGDTIDEPKSPKKDNYSFLEWTYNDEKFSFDTKIDKDIILIAKWKDEDNKDIESTENNQKPSSDSKNPTTDNKKPTGGDSTSVKNNVFNLKDNIMVKQVHSETLCGFAMFIDNFKEVFPNADSSYNTVDYYPFDDDSEVGTSVTSKMLSNNFNKIKFNTTKENKAKSTLENIKKGNYTGISGFKYSYDNHKFTYSFDYLQFLKSSTFSSKTDGISVYKKMEEAFGGALTFIGPCGGASPEYEVLTKELCSKYNLKCE